MTMDDDKALIDVDVMFCVDLTWILFHFVCMGAL